MHMYVCMYMCMCICMYVYTYTASCGGPQTPNAHSSTLCPGPYTRNPKLLTRNPDLHTLNPKQALVRALARAWSAPRLRAAHADDRAAAAAIPAKTKTGVAGADDTETMEQDAPGHGEGCGPRAFPPNLAVWPSMVTWQSPPLRQGRAAGGPQHRYPFIYDTVFDLLSLCIYIYVFIYMIYR